MQTMLDLAIAGTDQLFDQQRRALQEILPALLPRP
jgi:hypothetical protein